MRSYRYAILVVAFMLAIIACEVAYGEQLGRGQGSIGIGLGIAEVPADSISDRNEL